MKKINYQYCKTFMIFLLAFSISICLLYNLSSTIYAAPSGDGTADNPYIISSPDDLAWISGASNKYFKLANDIDMSEYLKDTRNKSRYVPGQGWTPIGNFSGNFDGCNHVISGVWFNYSTGTAGDLGLFGSTSGATISNLGLVIGSAGFTNTVIEKSVGGLVGSTNKSTISNCYVTTSGGIISGQINVGGFIGKIVESTVTNCYTTVDVASTYTSNFVYVGGFASNISGTSPSNIIGCFATGNIAVNSTPTSYTGGFVGLVSNNVSVKSCYSTGIVNGKNNCGGFVGNINNTLPIITSCYSLGVANGTGTNTGGFIGANSGGTIKNCYSTGGVKTVGSKFAGSNSGTIQGCVYNSDTSYGTIDASSTAKSTQEMKMKSTFTADPLNWDFDNTNNWGMYDDFSGYPYAAAPTNHIYVKPVVGSKKHDGDIIDDSSLLWTVFDDNNYKKFINQYSPINANGVKVKNNKSNIGMYDLYINSVTLNPLYQIRIYNQEVIENINLPEANKIKYEIIARFVFYHANGGIGSNPLDISGYMVSQHPIVKFEDELTMGGFMFTKWNTKQDGTGISFSPKNLITFSSNIYNVNGDVDLYAIWIPSNITRVIITASIIDGFERFSSDTTVVLTGTDGNEYYTILKLGESKTIMNLPFDTYSISCINPIDISFVNASAFDFATIVTDNKFTINSTSLLAHIVVNNAKHNTSGFWNIDEINNIIKYK